jgi:2-(1,2-epoxy-1,2-dihydrophenyl)acetyl-CoA isomerase
MDYGTLRYDLEDRVARITLDRPPRNALNLEMARELMHAATRCDEDRRVRAVLISGAGGTFGVGGDLEEFSEAGDDLPLLLKELATQLHAAVSRLVRMRAPVVAAVEGAVAGGGMSLVLASDVALAAKGATFRHAYSRLGISPDGASTYFLPRLVGMRRAQEFALTGRVLSAEEAREWGLVTRVVPDAELAGAASSAARELAAGPTESLGATKRLFHRGWTETLETQMELETRELADAARTSDAREGISAFLEKRPPEFSGV